MAKVEFFSLLLNVAIAVADDVCCNGFCVLKTTLLAQFRAQKKARLFLLCPPRRLELPPTFVNSVGCCCFFLYFLSVLVGVVVFIVFGHDFHFVLSALV